MVLSIVGIAAFLGDFGLSMASIQSQTITQAQRSNLFWTNAALGLVLSAAIYLLAGPIAAFYGRPELVSVTQVVSISFLINALGPQFRAEMTSKLRFKWLAATDVSAQIVGLLVAIIAALAGWGYWALVTQQLVVAFVTLVVLVIGAGWFPSLPSRRAAMRALYTYGINILGVQTVIYITSNIDNLLVGKFSGAAALGVYSKAYQIFRLPLLQIAAPMTRVALPILSKLQGDPRYDAYVLRAQVILSYSFGGVFFVLAAVADPAVRILLGPKWDAAVPIFAILAIGGVFQALGYVYYWIFLSKALTAMQFRYNLISRSLMVAMMCIGVIWGPIGVAIGVSLGQFGAWFILTVFAIPKTGVDTRAIVALTVRPMVVFTGLILVTLPVSLLVINSWNPWLELLVLTAIMVVYLGLIWLVWPAVRRDVMLIWDAVRRVRTRSH